MTLPKPSIDHCVEIRFNWSGDNAKRNSVRQKRRRIAFPSFLLTAAKEGAPPKK